ncbi:MAG: hypothetical protein GY696_02090, partial [Gammaproteobacteria bacterium]|nr:hypothetical protein [Gammaproteobacteria bacterium]
EPDPNIPIKQFVQEHCPPLPANFLPRNDEPDALTEMRRRRHGMDRSCVSNGRRCKSLTEDEYWRLFIWTYYRLCEQVDRQVGELLRTLCTAPLGNRLVIR